MGRIATWRTGSADHRRVHRQPRRGSSTLSDRPVPTKGGTDTVRVAEEAMDMELVHEFDYGS